MLAVLHAGDEAYGMQIRRQLEARLSGSIAIGAVYATLDRLEHKGFVTSRLAPAADGRGGRPRRYFELEGAGTAALEASREAHAAMWQGVAFDSGTSKT